MKTEINSLSFFMDKPYVLLDGDKEVGQVKADDACKALEAGRKQFGESVRLETASFDWGCIEGCRTYDDSGGDAMTVIAIDPNCKTVRLQFRRPTLWFSFDVKSARGAAKMLLEQADQIEARFGKPKPFLSMAGLTQ